MMLRLLHRLGMGAASRLRNLYYRGLGVRMGGYVWMRAVEISRNWATLPWGPTVRWIGG